MDDLLHVWRALILTVGLTSASVNLSLAIGLIRHRRLLPHSKVSAGYPLVAGLTACVSAYFRLRDGISDLPLNVGDFTALVPSMGFLIVGLWGWRVLGRTVGHAEVKEILE